MALFGKNETEKKDAQVKPAPAKKKAKSASKATKKVAAPAVHNSEIAYAVLVEPWITEKSHAAMALNKYIFKVKKTATKKQVEVAIRNLYGVTVEKIAMVIIHQKKRNYGRNTGWKAGYKKAIVTLKEGDKIELFAGV